MSEMQQYFEQFHANLDRMDSKQPFDTMTGAVLPSPSGSWEVSLAIMCIAPYIYAVRYDDGVFVHHKLIEGRDKLDTFVEHVFDNYEESIKGER